MKWKKFDVIYANGSSLTAGGGLEHNIIKNVYKEKFNITWVDEKDVTYPKLIADHFNVPVIQDAQSGSGSHRLIRRVYEYVEKYGIDVAKRTLFLLELTDPLHRVEMWCEKIQDHIIVNVRYDEDGNVESFSVSERISPTDRKYEFEYFEDIKDDVLAYLKKFHNPIVYTNKFINEVTGLFSFFEQNEIDYFFTYESQILLRHITFNNELTRNRKLVVQNGIQSVNHFCHAKKLTIKDETEGFTVDTHPGYFGNAEYAKEAIKFIESKLKPKIYVIGDSFTQSFQNHYESNIEWFMKYYDYKKIVPKSFCDILSDYYDVEIVNKGMNGSSNYKVVEVVTNLKNEVRKQDILIVGFTSILRFELATSLNNFQSVIPFSYHPSPNDDVSVKAIEEYGKNRATYDVYWSEITNYIRLLNGVFNKNKIFYWTWVKPEQFVPETLFSQTLIDEKTSIIFANWKFASDKLKEIATNDADYLIDLSKKIDITDVKYFLSKGKKLIFFNQDRMTKEKFDEFFKDIKFSWFFNKDFQKECYDFMIPYKERETIYDETYGNVDDRHYSEKGQKELATDFISVIDKQFISLTEEQLEIVKLFDNKKNRGVVELTPDEEQIIIEPVEKEKPSPRSLI